jgi:signal transduction histidine kinase
MIYGIPPILLALFIKKFNSMAFFYGYVGFLFVFTQLFAVFYAIEIFPNFIITGGNIAYSSLILLSFTIVILIRDPKIVRNIILIEIILNVFLFFLYFLLYLVLSDSEQVINIYNVFPEIFRTTISVNIISLILFIVEIILMFFILEKTKDHLKPKILLFSSFILIFIGILCLDGFLFPLFLNFAQPNLGSEISGGINSKLLLGLLYSPFLVTFLLIFREDIKKYLKEPFNVRYVIVPPKNRLIKKIKKIEKDLEDSEKKYYEAYNRVKYYKNLFSHDISHIIHNIALSIKLLETFQEKRDSLNSQKYTEIYDILNYQVRNAKNLISNINKLSLFEEDSSIDLRLKNINLLEYLENAIEFVYQGYQDLNIQIKIESPYKNIEVMANEFLFNIFENILINAIKYNDKPNKEINIRISKIESNKKRNVKIEFIDNGIGIPDKRKEEIFKKGHKELKGSKGLGLGLSLVSKILYIYEGKILVKNRVKDDYSKGSNIIVIIPQS